MSHDDRAAAALAVGELLERRGSAAAGHWYERAATCAGWASCTAATSRSLARYRWVLWSVERDDLSPVRGMIERLAEVGAAEAHALRRRVDSDHRSWKTDLRDTELLWDWELGTQRLSAWELAQVTRCRLALAEGDVETAGRWLREASHDQHWDGAPELVAALRERGGGPGSPLVRALRASLLGALDQPFADAVLAHDDAAPRTCRHCSCGCTYSW